MASAKAKAKSTPKTQAKVAAPAAKAKAKAVAPKSAPAKAKAPAKAAPAKAKASGATARNALSIVPGAAVLREGAYLARAIERLDDVLDEAKGSDPWPALLGRVVEGFFAYEAADDEFAALWIGGLLSGDAYKVRTRVRDALATRLAQALEPSGLGDDEGLVVATHVLETLASLAAGARREPESQAEALADEAKRVVLAYVASYVGLPDEDEDDDYDA